MLASRPFVLGDREHNRDPARFAGRAMAAFRRSRGRCRWSAGWRSERPLYWSDRSRSSRLFRNVEDTAYGCGFRSRDRGRRVERCGDSGWLPRSRVIGSINGLAPNPENSAFRQTVKALWVVQGSSGC
jgi:hypothetical protein